MGNEAKLILIIGPSGSGCSTAIHALEDRGFQSIQNFPIELLETYINLTTEREIRHAALVPEVYSENDVHNLVKFINDKQPYIFYLETKDDVLVKRYKETRRPHPVFSPSLHKTILDAIQTEKNLLSKIKDLANYRIDTSELKAHELKQEIDQIVNSLAPDCEQIFRINFISFGFKSIAPINCDLVLDVRFLPNPYYTEELKNKTGLDPAVQEYVLNNDLTKKFIEKQIEMLNFLIPNYMNEGKHFLNVGVGCTGGQHRSVVLAEKLAESLKDKIKDSIVISTQHQCI